MSTELGDPRVCGAAPVLPVGDEGGAAVPGGAVGASQWQIMWERVGEQLAAVRALWRDFTGESAYDHYVERHRREHPDHEPMTARQFWRARADFDEENVSTGCC